MGQGLCGRWDKEGEGGGTPHQEDFGAVAGGLTSRILAERSEGCANAEGRLGTHVPALPSLGPACSVLGADPFRPMEGGYWPGERHH